jgi:hypothetical protein
MQIQSGQTVPLNFFLFLATTMYGLEGQCQDISGRHFVFVRKLAMIFTAQCALPVSKTPLVTYIPKLTLFVVTPVANLPLQVTTTSAANCYRSQQRQC